MGINPAGKHSFVPCLRGKFNHNGEIAVFAVWASRRKKHMELPLVVVCDKTCKIIWIDCFEKVIGSFRFE
ncbi:hypothetical protein ACFLTP_02245 [Chloroflexota bacterium]